jgi:hypothetical protein
MAYLFVTLPLWQELTLQITRTNFAQLDEDLDLKLSVFLFDWLDVAFVASVLLV